MDKEITDWYSLFGKSIKDPELDSIIHPQSPVKFEYKTFKDKDGTHEYYFCFQLGISLSFKDSIFSSVFLYGQYDKKFKAYEGPIPYFLSLYMNNTNIVSFLGEPNKKTAGRTVAISLAYERLGIEFTFMSPIWDLTDNRIGFVCLFPPIRDTENKTLICALCAKQSSNFCAQCKLVSYCSKDCQSAHWKVHKIHCNKYFKDKVPQ